MTAFSAQTVRFFIPEPKAIHCIALHPNLKELALSRSDNAVELWDISCALSLSGAPVCVVRCPAAAGASVESLAWCGGRLFSTGLHGHILEHSTRGLEVTNSVSVTGGAAWCLAAEPQLQVLAAGTEDGHVVLYQLAKEGLNFEKRLVKQEHRILSLAWHSGGHHLAAGSVNTVCLYDTQSGATISRISVGRRTGSKETLVWSVALLDDMTIVTGDSRGRVSFWDGRLGALISAADSHRADVLSVTTAGPRQDVVFAAGVDPTIARFERITGPRHGAATWVRSTKLELHVRDIRALVATDKWLISGGVDASLVFDIQGKKEGTIRTPPLPQVDTVLPADRLPGFVLVSDTSLQLWRLSQSVSPVTPPSKLLELSCRQGEAIVCAAVTSDASWLAYSTHTQLRLHHLDLTGPRPSLLRMRMLPAAAAGPACQLCFTADAASLLLLTADGRLVRLQLTADTQKELTAKVLDSADSEDQKYEDGEDEDAGPVPGPLRLLTASRDGRCAAVADRAGSVVVWDLEEGEVTCRLPRRNCPAVALTFRPTNSACLLAVYADRRIVEYDTHAAHFTAWSRWAAEHVPGPWRGRTLPLRHVTFSGCGARVLLHDDTSVCSLDSGLANSAVTTVEVKRKRGGRGAAATAVDTVSHTLAEPVVLTDRYRHLLYFGGLTGDQLLVVEAPAAKIEDKLPPALKRKRYGVA